MKKTWKKGLVGIMATTLLVGGLIIPSQAAGNDPFIDGFVDVAMENRPRTRWWVPGSHMTKAEIEAEIKSMVNAGFGGAEIVPVATGGEGGDSIDWGSEQWNEMIKHMLEVAGEYDFTIDFTMTPAWPLALPTIKDVNDPSQGAQMELDRAYQDGITKDNPFNGQLPMSDEALEDVSLVNGKIELAAVTIAKYVDKENKVLDFDSCISLDINNVITNEDGTYTTSWTPEDDGEYVLFSWWQHPSGNQKYGNNQVDHYSKAGSQMIIDYWENNLIPYYGDGFKNVKSLFIDSLEFETHLDWTYGLLTGFEEKNNYDVAAYLPAIYDQDAIGNYMGEPEPDFSFNKNNEALQNDFKDYLTDLYIENHLKPLQEFCQKYGLELRYQTSYGKTLETARTAMYVDIPETETLYGDDYLDFYRLQSGAVHLTDKELYSIESAAEWTEQWNEKDPETGEYKTRGNGEKDCGNYQQTFQSQAWHVQRAFAGGVNQVVFHGYAYNGQYDGPGSVNGYVEGVQWPGFDGFEASTWSNSWGERQPNWTDARSYTDFIARNQYLLRQGEAKVDLAIYDHSYYENIDFVGCQKIYEDNGLLEQNGYTYDFVSPASLDLENATVTNGRLDYDGPAYQALILNYQEDLPEKTAKRFLEYAKNGLPIIIVGDLPSQNAFYQESDINPIISELMQQTNVRQVASVDQVYQVLQELQITPAAAYSQQTKLLNVHRQDEDKDIYYFYNYGDVDTYREDPSIADINTIVTLKGSGIPYQFNTWTGKITPIAKYSSDGNTVTVDLSLSGNDSTIIVLMDEPLKDVATATSSDIKVAYNENDQLIAIGSNQEANVVLSDGKQVAISLPQAQDSFVIDNWDLTIESWLPGDNPTSTKKEYLEFADLKQLVPWNQLDGCQDVSGIGTYKATFEVDQGWQEGSGAYLDLGTITDTYELLINGQTIPVNQIDTLVDIGPYLNSGTNTIEVKVASTLLNAVLAVNQDDDRDGDEYGILNDVTVIPYNYTLVNQEITNDETNEVIDDSQSQVDDQTSDQVTKQQTKKVATGDETMFTAALLVLVASGIIIYQLKKRY